MKNKFEILKWDVCICDGVGSDDLRIVSNDLPKISSVNCMLGHIDVLTTFVNKSKKEFAIICEDDICINRQLPAMMQNNINIVVANQLDILLLGYLMPYKIPNNDYNIYSYSDHLWGTQMYLITKKYAKYIIDNFNIEYCKQSMIKKNELTPFSADWIITKKTDKKALIYPPLCIENGNIEKYTHDGQKLHHLASHCLHINSDFI